MNRSELYEAVWSKPLFHVARQLGMQDRALAAVCKKENIPTPPRGYWRKVATGHSPDRPPLGGASPIEDRVVVQRKAPLPQVEDSAGSAPWPTEFLKSDIRRYKGTRLTTPKLSAPSAAAVDAMIDVLAAQYQVAQARRALVAEVLAILGAQGEQTSAAVRRLLQLVQQRERCDAKDTLATLLILIARDDA